MRLWPFRYGHSAEECRLLGLIEKHRVIQQRRLTSKLLILRKVLSLLLLALFAAIRAQEGRGLVLSRIFVKRS